MFLSKIHFRFVSSKKLDLWQTALGSAITSSLAFTSPSPRELQVFRGCPFLTKVLILSSLDMTETI